jgi:xanthine dehydrogenase accessory factor
MKELKMWQYISNQILLGNKIVLLIVANASNASPGRTGFKMVVSSNKTTFGTIGGGIMEYDIINEINNSFVNNIEFNCIRKLHHSKLASGEKSGLICGGIQTIIFKSIDKSSLNTITDILQNIENNESGLLSISSSSFQFFSKKQNDNDIVFSVDNNSVWLFEENIGNPKTVYIVGGGHVGLAVSRIMRTLDFNVVVFDSRNSVQTLEENTFTNKIITTDYKNIAQYIKEGAKSYVVVVTPNHDGDRDALQSVLRLDLKYIGSMGSKKKIISIFNQLKSAGFTEKELERIKTPIGLEIEAESPEEIAISIAAEIILIKNS